MKGATVLSVLLMAGGVHATTINKMSVQAETIEFKAKTNLPALEITGSSKTATGALDMFESQDGIGLRNIRISIPVEPLKTGMAVRDRHMREKIFTTTDGRVPDISFESADIQCAKPAAVVTCSARGQISLHGQQHDATIPVTLTKDSGRYLAKADFSLALKDFGVEPPSHFGISIENQVGVHVALVGNVISVENTIDASRLAEVKPVPAPKAIPTKRPEPTATNVTVAAQAPSTTVAAPPAADLNLPTGTAPASAIEVQLADGTVIRGLAFSQAMTIIRQHKPAVSAEQTLVQGRGHAGQYALQVAAFDRENQAVQQVSQLKTKGLNAFYYPVTIKGKEWFRVLIGGFKDMKSATRQREQVGREAGVSTLIVQKII